MKMIIGALLVLFSLVVLVWGLIACSYSYDVAVGQYVKLADDASTAQLKTDYLSQYTRAIDARILRNDARFIFKCERLTRDTQLKVIGSLMERLRDTTAMDPKSFEYQQAMLQLTGQEFDHTLQEVDIIMQSCWLRQSPGMVFGLWFSWLFFLVGILVGIPRDEI